MAIKTIIATIQGQEVELSYNEATGYYEGTGQAGNDSSFPQDGGYFPVSITATDYSEPSLSTIVDSDDFESLRLFVYEEKAPTIEILTPTSGAYITETTKPEIQFKIIDNGTSQTSICSGVDVTSIVLKIDGVAVTGVVFDETEGVGTYTPSEALSNGEHTITVDATDNDENAAVTAKSIVIIDNQVPSNELYTPSDGYVTSQSRIIITGKTTDTSTPITVKITLNGTQIAEIEAGSDGLYSYEAELSERENVITSQAIDDAGNASEPISRTVIYNTSAPVFEEVEILYKGSQVSDGNKVPAGGFYTIRCKVTTS